MNEKQTMSDWSFVLWWLLTCALGVAFAGLVVFSTIWPLVEAVEDLFGDAAAVFVFGTLFGAALALGAGLGPGLLLKSRGIAGDKWVAASVIAGALSGGPAMAILISSFDSGASPESISGLLVGLIMGLAVGIGQWYALQTDSAAARLWPAISSAAFAVAFGAGTLFNGEGREMILLAVIGLLIGAITGPGMIWLQRRQTAVQQPLS
jgi:hypothetical protein